VYSPNVSIIGSLARSHQQSLADLSEKDKKKIMIPLTIAFRLLVWMSEI
jgi:hypothetical protein